MGPFQIHDRNIWRIQPAVFSSAPAAPQDPDLTKKSLDHLRPQTPWETPASFLTSWNNPHYPTTSSSWELKQSNICVWRPRGRWPVHAAMPLSGEDTIPLKRTGTSVLGHFSVILSAGFQSPLMVPIKPTRYRSQTVPPSARFCGFAAVRLWRCVKPLTFSHKPTKTTCAGRILTTNTFNKWQEVRSVERRHLVKTQFYTGPGSVLFIQVHKVQLVNQTFSLFKYFKCLIVGGCWNWVLWKVLFTHIWLQSWSFTFMIRCLGENNVKSQNKTWILSFLQLVYCLLQRPWWLLLELHLEFRFHWYFFAE